MINRDMDIFSNQYATEIIWKSFLPFIKATEGEIVKVGVVLPIPQFEDFVVAQLCTETLTNITRYPKSMIEINDSGYYVVGDIHGNIIDLLRIVSKIYQESEDNIPKIIFLGDYVDRGHFSLEVVLLIFALYNKYPNTVVMLRGNHEFGRSENNKCTKGGSILTEMEPLYSSYETIYRSILTVFSWLPLAVLLNRKCLLIHGGLSPKLKSLDDIKNIRLPISELNDNLVTDILWSDPCSSISSYVSSPRGLGVLFGRTVLKNFLAQNKLKYIIRGHQCVQSGIETPMNGIVTVFSTSYYSDEENLGGYIQFKNITDLKYRTFRLSPFRSISRKMAQFYSVRTGGIRSRTITITMSSSKLPSLYTSKTTASSRNILSDQIKKRRLSTHSPGSIKSTKSSTSKQLSFDL